MSSFMELFMFLFFGWSSGVQINVNVLMKIMLLLLSARSVRRQISKSIWRRGGRIQ